MVPRIPKQTLHEWRRKRPEWNQEIDDAWEVGCAEDQMTILRIGDGIQPLMYDGHTTRAQRAKYRADVKRDRLRIWAAQQRLQALNRRYSERHVLAGDMDAPLIPSKFVVTPVRSQHAEHAEHEEAPATDAGEEE